MYYIRVSLGRLASDGWRVRAGKGVARKGVLSLFFLGGSGTKNRLTLNPKPLTLSPKP